jgi:hypothetical protein
MVKDAMCQGRMSEWRKKDVIEVEAQSHEMWSVDQV